MDTERMEAVASLISADTERRLVREILGDLTKEERAALREKVLAHMLESLKSSTSQSVDYTLKQEVETGLRDHVRRVFNEKHAERLKAAIEASVERYFQPDHIHKIVDGVAPASLSAAVKKIVDRVAQQFAAARPG